MSILSMHARRSVAVAILLLFVVVPSRDFARAADGMPLPDERLAHVLQKEFLLEGTVDCGRASGQRCNVGPTVTVWTSDVTGERQRVTVDLSWVQAQLDAYDQDDPIRIEVQVDPDGTLRAVGIRSEAPANRSNRAPADSDDDRSSPDLKATPSLGAAPGATATPVSGPGPQVGRQVPLEGSLHVAQGTSISYASRPPTSGPHYPTWSLTYGVFNVAPPTGNWVHNLEHGSVAILYNCPGGCPAIVQQLTALYPTLPLGQNAVGGQPRVLIFPYTDMDATIAAVSWGWLLEQSTLNTDELRTFVGQRLDQGGECTNFQCVP